MLKTGSIDVALANASTSENFPLLPTLTLDARIEIEQIGTRQDDL